MDPERQEEGKGPLSNLNHLKESSTSVKLAKAYILYSLREPRLSLGVLEAIDYDAPPPPPSVTNSHFSAEGSAFGSLGSSSGATTLEAALSRTGTLAGSIGVTELSKRLDGEVGDGKVWAVIERARGRCLQGAPRWTPLRLRDTDKDAYLAMAQERLHDFKAALASYGSGLALLDRLAISRTSPQPRNKADLFAKYRELWRWAERILRGAALVAAKLKYVGGSHLTIAMSTDLQHHQA